MSLTYHDLKERFTNHLGNDTILGKHREWQVYLCWDSGDIPQYLPFKLMRLPDDCSDCLDHGHLVLYYNSEDHEEQPEYSWNDLLADIGKMTPDQRHEQDVTVFDEHSKEIHQISYLDTNDEGFLALIIED